jgi:hypothetical protein
MTVGSSKNFISIVSFDSAIIIEREKYDQGGKNHRLNDILH